MSAFHTILSCLSIPAAAWLLYLAPSKILGEKLRGKVDCCVSDSQNFLNRGIELMKLPNSKLGVITAVMFFAGAAVAAPTSQYNMSLTAQPVEMASGRAPHMATSLMVPCTASEPMLPPGKNSGRMT